MIRNDLPWHITNMKITLKFGNYVQSNNFNNILTVSNERKFQFCIAANSHHQYYRFMIGMTSQAQTNDEKVYDPIYHDNLVKICCCLEKC